MVANDKNEHISTMQAAHRRALKQLSEEAVRAMQNAALMANAIDEVLKEKGGKINVQPQMAFLTGSLARMQKDIGVIEYLQHQGVSQKPAPKK